LYLARVDQPCTTQELAASVIEHLEEEHVDRDAPIIEIADDPFAAGVEGRRNDHDLMTVVDGFLVERLPEPISEIRREAPLGTEPRVDRGDPLRIQPLGPGGVVERLCDDLARGAVSFQFHEDQRPVRGDREQVDASTKAGIDLAPDQHPLGGEDAGLSHNHVLEALLRGEDTGRQLDRRIGDGPDDMLDRNLLGRLQR
jgi:hypothetical protein